MQVILADYAEFWLIMQMILADYSENLGLIIQMMGLIIMILFGFIIQILFG